MNFAATTGRRLPWPRASSTRVARFSLRWTVICRTIPPTSSSSSQKMDEGYDIVVGWRFNRQDKLISRRFLRASGRRLIGKVTGVPIRDNGCSLKAFRASLIKQIPLYSEMHRFIPRWPRWPVRGSPRSRCAITHGSSGNRNTDCRAFTSAARSHGHQDGGVVRLAPFALVQPARCCLPRSASWRSGALWEWHGGEGRCRCPSRAAESSFSLAHSCSRPAVRSAS